MVDGNHVMYTYHYQGFIWKIQVRSFTEDLLIISLGECDMVLGNDWMKKHNPTKCDHERRCVILGEK